MLCSFFRHWDSSELFVQGKEFREILELLKIVRTFSYHRKEMRLIENKIKGIAKSLKINLDPENEIGAPKHSLCPERFLGTLEGFPLYEHGFESTDCGDEKKLNELVTVVFDLTDQIYDSNEQLMRRVLDAANAHFDGIKIVAIIASSVQFSSARYPHVNFVSTTRE